MTESANLVSCYNKGCGKKFDPSENEEGEVKIRLEFSRFQNSRNFCNFIILDSCIHHPGAPIFHDAYKGWSCCNKKSTDFTEFLNFKGCAIGNHSNIKPEEPVKKTELLVEIDEKPVERKPLSNPLTRPDVNSPLVTLEPTVNAIFKKQMDEQATQKAVGSVDKSVITNGTSCKRGGCTGSYNGPTSDKEICTFHPGIPVFHEGCKYWSCCKRKTTDFTAFLSQPGCDTGTHLWVKQGDENQINCRWDWHQTASNVVITVYAKAYDYEKSFVKVNPVRISIKLVFPQQGNAEFNIDLELKGIINVSKTTAHMFGTKIEIIMPKAEGCHWTGLHFPIKEVEEQEQPELAQTLIERQPEKNEDENESESDVDLDDIELERGAHILELGELARTSALVEES